MWTSLKSLNRLSRTHKICVVSVLCGILVTLSIIAEYALNIRACRLCLIQRGLHVLTLASSILFFRFSRVSIFRICQILLATSALVAGYHSLVQYGLIKDPCKANLQVQNISDYKKALLKSYGQKASCGDRELQVGGVPASTFNCLLSLISFAFLVDRLRPNKWSKRKEQLL